jgi:hypothetical protein
MAPHHNLGMVLALELALISCYINGLIAVRLVKEASTFLHGQAALGQADSLKEAPES